MITRTEARHRMALTALLLAIVLSVVVPAVAAAATHYAAPSGAGDCSSPANACSLASAIGAASMSDEIVLAGGTYPTVTTTISDGGKIDIHPAAGAGRPVIPISATGQLRLDSGSGLRDVDIQGAGSGNGVLFASHGSLLERLTISCTGSNCIGLEIAFDSTLRDSTIVSSGFDAIGAKTESSNATVSYSLRNDTIIASGSASIGVFANAIGASGNVTSTVVNTIAIGEGADIHSSTATGGTTQVHVSHSNIATTVEADAGAHVIDDGGNQSDAPAFVDAAGGDLRQAAGSPTIDAGTDDPANGTVDLGGDLRILGARTDIGADEFVSAPAIGALATVATGPTTASVSAPVTPGGLATTVHVEYGTTNAYGSTTPPKDAGSGIAAVTQSFALSNLAPGTTYHVRLVAQSAGGVTTSSDSVVKTPLLLHVPKSPAPPIQSPSPVVLAKPGIALHSQTVKVRKGKARVSLTCPASAASGCKGILRLTVEGRKLTKHYALKAGKVGSVAVKLPKQVLRRLAHAGRRGLTGKVTLPGGAAAQPVKIKRG